MRAEKDISNDILEDAREKPIQTRIGQREERKSMLPF